MDTNQTTEGQANAEAQLLTSLSSDCTIVVFRGAHGVGKSQVVAAVRQRLEGLGTVKVFSARCSEWSKQQNLRALEVCLTNEIAKSGRPKLGAFATNAAKDIPFVGHSTSAALSALLANSDRKSTSGNRTVLPARVEELLAVLNREIGSNSGVVVFDEAQWLDQETCDLLTIVRDKSVIRDFPCLTRTKFLLSFSDEFIEGSLEEYVRQIGGETCQTIILEGLGRDEFADLWSGLAPEVQLPDVLAKRIYDIANGNINLVRHIATYLASTPSISMQGQDLAQDLLTRAIEFQLQGIGEQGSLLKNLLEKASLIGLDFTIAELACLTGSKLDVVRSGLSLAKQQRVVQDSGSFYSFSDISLQRVFERGASYEGKLNHQKFADCLRAIRPHEYEARGLHALKAGHVDEAGEMLALAALKSIRLGENVNTETDAMLRSACPDVVPFYQCIRDGLEAYNRGDYSEAASKCEQMTACSYERLSAEANLLLARIATTTIGFVERGDIDKRLDLAFGFIDEDEIELLFRARLIKIINDAYEDRIDDARMLAGRTTKLLKERSNFDPYSAYLLQLLRSNSDMYFADEIARSELNLAVKFLVPNGIESVSSPTTAYIILANSVGNSLQCGQFEEALQQAHTADQIVATHPQIKFPRLDILVNNQLMSDWFLGAQPHREVLAQYELLIANHKNSGDKWVLKSNMAAMYLALSMVDQASQILNDQDNLELDSGGDVYFSYFMQNNLAALQFDQGDRKLAIKTFRAMDGMALKLPFSVRQFLVMRHRTISQILSSNLSTKVTWDDMPKSALAGKLGTSYRFFGRGLLFSDLQFWGEF